MLTKSAFFTTLFADISPSTFQCLEKEVEKRNIALVSVWIPENQRHNVWAGSLELRLRNSTLIGGIFHE
jgi:hypothetical protein